jgi:hypothetical protein
MKKKKSKFCKAQADKNNTKNILQNFKDTHMEWI